MFSPNILAEPVGKAETLGTRPLTALPILLSEAGSPEGRQELRNDSICDVVHVLWCLWSEASPPSHVC